MVYIETFERKSKIAAFSTPLLFVHGACLGAWCWQDGFLDFFAEAGYQAIALNLRGHGGSATDKPLQKVRIDDYVADVASVAEKLAHPPVVIGHSMGGLIVQRFAANYATSGVVMMSPSPFAGMLSQSLRLLRTHPGRFFIASLWRDIHRIYPDNRRVRNIMFSPSTPEEIVTRCRERLQKESWTATQEMNPPLKQAYDINVPMLVLGAEYDGTVLPDAICDTAVAYKAPCHIFKNMGHNLMLEPDWREVAAYIQNWLRENIVN
ncbi:alpha/beta hydrolase [Candidatus Leptofilum sp.]|uniref:alpha/beta hydrolase n=1 Tax=Candidatus Leptofilum sp. TaxID=3241576 RepID=UPI003B5BBE21